MYFSFGVHIQENHASEPGQQLRENSKPKRPRAHINLLFYL